MKRRPHLVIHGAKKSANPMTESRVEVVQDNFRLTVLNRSMVLKDTHLKE